MSGHEYLVQASEWREEEKGEREGEGAEPVRYHCVNLFITELSGCDLDMDHCHATHRCQPGVRDDTDCRATRGPEGTALGVGAMPCAQPRAGGIERTLPRHHEFCAELPRRMGRANPWYLP